MSDARHATRTLDLPPLLRGQAISGDPLAEAVRIARTGIDPGLIVHQLRPERLAAAIILSPEAPLADAMAMVFAGANAFADAFGALAPAEIAAEFDWPGGFRVNGARCGGLRAAAATPAPEVEPDWLVIAIDVPFRSTGTREPGHTPDVTTLYAEGCGSLTPTAVLESWSRHMLHWIDRWLDDGMARLHRDWSGRAASLGRDVVFDLASSAWAGRFVGLDDRGGMLLKTATETRLLPLTLMLEEA
ncbi:MAG: hypothetical protein KDA73_07710 [Rhodobacteraceae bacterium]|nr:hypothetical protein [Paracoccaceae bacterium]